MALKCVKETRRVTKPYSDAAWQDILAAGRQVDQRLARGGVRLTMGGEPTFVSTTDRDGEEWNTAALGPTKRRIAGRLIRRLADLWLPGSALQYTMGKQYPGEQLPRWALYAQACTDGEPVWHDSGLLASDDTRDSADARDATRFAAALAQRRQRDPSLVIPAHEDVHSYLWREKKLSANVLVEDTKLRDPLARARLARVSARASPVGAVLPLRRVMQEGARRWQSGRWFLRDGALCLISGDSPIGFRRPLESLPWADPETLAGEADQPRDPFARAESLPSAQRIREAAALGAQGSEAFRPVPQDLPVIGKQDPGVVRTALTVEARGGIIHIFFPPLAAAEDWLDLAAAIEATAAEAGRPVILEGYLPPSDDRLQHVSVTPDPGVIEVNIHPAHDWPSMVKRTEELYEPLAGRARRGKIPEGDPTLGHRHCCGTSSRT
jgi:uncharacterized protein (DUF2126 family)